MKTSATVQPPVAVETDFLYIYILLLLKKINTLIKYHNLYLYKVRRFFQSNNLNKGRTILHLVLACVAPGQAIKTIVARQIYIYSRSIYFFAQRVIVIEDFFFSSSCRRRAKAIFLVPKSRRLMSTSRRRPLGFDVGTNRCLSSGQQQFLWGSSLYCCRYY